ncbi:MAG: hypothetical protein CSA20_02490 [Deltaproteobacteria bacterium]|nr:MAG: hypothetical protein CSA20_02490 [Deltaproteobacteria bacterium]
MNNQDLQPFLVARKLVKHFADTTAVDSVNLELFPGELLAILGSSGCGKSTLLRSIAGLVRPDSGSLSCNNEQWIDENIFIPPENRDCGMVFQDMALFPHLSIAENIGFAVSKKQKRKVVEKMLELVGLEGLGQRMVHQLSGGQQQRAALARSLAPEPGLLLLDEPFSGLDLKLRQTMRWEVRNILKKQGVTAILVTHDQSEAFAFADTVAVMSQGQIKQQDTPKTIYQHPATADIAAFVGEANFMSMEEALCSFPQLNTLNSTIKHAANKVMFRPEDFTLDPSTESATVVDTEFQGAWQNVVLRLDCGPEITIISHTLEFWQQGQRLNPQPRRGCIYSPEGQLAGIIES